MTAIQLSSVPEAARADAFRWKTILEPILMADRRRVQLIHDTARTLEVSEATVRAKFYAFKRDGLKGLIDKRLCGKDAWNTRRKSGLTEADKQLVKQYCEKSNRGNKVAIRKLLEDWRKGVVTTDSPLDPSTNYPKGWSERNLLRAAPTKFELKAARIGRTAAAAHRQLVYTTRADLYVGSHYLFDDMWHDHECNDLDRALRGRPLEFHALDLYSACKFAWGMRLRVEREDGKMDGLKAADMRFLLAYVLGVYGYSLRGTVLIVEHGTAAIPEWLEKLLFEASNGLITVERSGMEGAAAHAGQYPGRSKGNFKFKAALESLGNLIHNEMGFLPGQTGKDRQHAPEQQHGLQKHNDALLAAISQLPAERVAMLQWPLLTVQQFQVIAKEIYDRINARTEHRLEGWDMNYVPDRRTGGMRRMAPVEVFNRGRRDLETLPPEVIAMILGVDFAEPRTVRNGMVEIKGSKVTGNVLRFSAQHLKEGETYQAVLNPYRPDTLWMFDSKGRYVGNCPSVFTPSRAEVEQVQRQCGEAARIEADALAPLRARHLQEAREKKAMHQHNTAVITGRPITPEEKAVALQGRRAVTFGRALATAQPAQVIADPADSTDVEDWSDSAPEPSQPAESQPENW